MHVCEHCSKALGRSHLGGESQSCAVCLGLFQPDGNLADRIHQAVLRALEPYGPADENCWSVLNNSCTMHPPGDIIFRFLLAKNDEGSSSAVVFADSAKQRSKDLLRRSLSSIQTKLAIVDTNSELANMDECGYLGLYVQLTPSPTVPRPPHLSSNSLSRKRKRRHNDNIQQGGDPRDNLQRRLASKGVLTWTVNQALTQTVEPCQADIFERKLPVSALEVHCIVWRLPFYVRGTYTKNRRDVSQTPFFAIRDSVKTRLGVTSVEEQIVPMVRRGCGDISSLNDDPSSVCRVFGAVKFHASGREDMDVRMLLPSPHQSATNATGRPFVCEVIDALRVPTPADLKAIRDEINRTDPIATEDESITIESGIRYYGKNPMGVGVSTLSLVPASAFKNLQAETEHKVKHYGCLCWSQKDLPETLESIQERLGIYPLSVAQKTPLRVLHRRALAVRGRRILSCRVVHRVDEHHFRLALSTEAGTYVKEFVHGDLGRTVPSVSTLLGCKTDILELDCEGVELSDDNVESSTVVASHETP